MSNSDMPAIKDWAWVGSVKGQGYGDKVSIDVSSIGILSGNMIAFYVGISDDLPLGHMGSGWTKSTEDNDGALYWKIAGEWEPEVITLPLPSKGNYFAQLVVYLFNPELDK